MPFQRPFPKFLSIILSKRVYFYGTLGIIAFLLGIVIYFITKPEIPEIPPLPQVTRGLISYWAFDEKGGQIVYDANAQHHNGRLGKSNSPDPADPQRYKKGKIGRALKFDGKDDYVIVENHPEFQISKEITIEGWFKVLGPANPSPEPVWLTDFRYRRQIIIDNRESEKFFRDSQILIVLDTASLIDQGKIQSNCQDLRFTDSDETTLLPYWIESGCNTEQTKIWVKIPFLPPKLEKILYFYYGNTQAENRSNFYQTMHTPPLLHWEYSQWGGKEIKAIITDKNYIIAVGSENPWGDLGWYGEWIHLKKGVKTGHYVKNSPLGADEINDLAIDRDNTVIFGGYDASPGNFQWKVEKKGWWTLTFNFSPGTDEIMAVATDSENNILLAGYDSVPGDNRWHLIKLNPKGKILWEYTINPSHQADIITDVKIDSKNNVIIAGYEKSVENDRWRIEKLSPAGNLLYSYRYNPSEGADILNAIAIDSKDNIIAVGYDFYPGNAQWRMIKIDQDGNKLWEWNLNPSPGFDELRAVAIDSNDNIIVAGNDSQPGNLEWTVIKFSPEGKQIWEWKYNPSEENDEIKDIEIDSENNIILAGSQPSLWPFGRIIKLSEKNLISPLPKIFLKSGEIQNSLFQNLIFGKAKAYGIFANENKITGFINQNLISAPLKPKVWNHFALTYDGTRLSLFLNGELINSQGLIEPILLNSRNLFIGYNFNGLIDELKLYNQALLPKEIKMLYYKK